jgi:hypothetical protein
MALGWTAYQDDEGNFWGIQMEIADLALLLDYRNSAGLPIAQTESNTLKPLSPGLPSPFYSVYNSLDALITAEGQWVQAAAPAGLQLRTVQVMAAEQIGMFNPYALQGAAWVVRNIPVPDVNLWNQLMPTGAAPYPVAPVTSQGVALQLLGAAGESRTAN